MRYRPHPVKEGPEEVHLDNGKQFVARAFKREARSRGIKLIIGRPYHPRGRGRSKDTTRSCGGS
jgi:transposase InsO family protein